MKMANTIGLELDLDPDTIDGKKNVTYLIQ